MNARAWAGLALLWLSMAVGCGGGGLPVENPAPIAAGRSPELTEQAILDALPKRAWTAEDVKPGRIVAFLSVRQHLLRVAIEYDAQQVRISYVDSDHLDAHEGKKGQVYAHKKVNAWMRRLAQDISTSLATVEQTAATSGGATENVNINAPGAAPVTTSPAPAEPAPAPAPAPAR